MGRHFRFGSGNREPAAGWIDDMKLTFNDQLIVVHGFLVTSNQYAPMILAQDFILQSHALPNPHKAQLKFEIPSEDGNVQSIVIPAHLGFGSQEKAEEHNASTMPITIIEGAKKKAWHYWMIRYRLD